MKCSELPRAAYRYWTLWGRWEHTRYYWQFLAYGPIANCETARGFYNAGKTELLILPPGESPMMAKRKCLREDYP